MRARILNAADAQGDSELRAKSGALARTPANIAAVWERAVARNPLLAEIEADVEMREVSPGHAAPYSRALARHLERAGVNHLYHDSSWDGFAEALGHDPDGVALLSSVSRYERGSFKKGMSTETDFGTGGADSVFTRISTSAPSTTYGVRLIIDSDELGRLDAYSFNADRYGRSGDSERSYRMRTAQIAERASSRGFDSGNESMFQGSISARSIREIRIRDHAQRERVKASLRSHGITQIGGRDLDEIIVGG